MFHLDNRLKRDVCFMLVMLGVMQTQQLCSNVTVGVSSAMMCETCWRHVLTVVISLMMIS